MTLPERRLAELDRISRERPLTYAEQREVIQRAREHRQNRARRMKYFLDPDVQQRAIARSRAYRQARA